MSLKKLGLTAMMVTALFAVFAGNAFGATSITTVEASWNSNGAPFGSTEATGETPVCSAAENLVLTGTILTSPAKLTATGVSCSGKLWNEGGMAIGKGTLSFSGITVNEPAGCKLNGETNGTAKLTTEPLTISVDMHGENGVEGKPVVTFNPVLEKFATIHLTGCAAEGRYKVTGTALGEASHETGIGSKNQQLTFNAATNAAGSLTLAGNPAAITGKANNELASGKEFQVN
jgi:hypothetical protein